MHKVFTLLSGGADSSTTLAIARNDFPSDPIECVTIDYGQRHEREMQFAAYQARSFEAMHRFITLPRHMLSGMLVDKGEQNQEIPNVSYGDLPVGISPTYVSFRNGTMLAVLAARAQSWIMEEQRNAYGDIPPPVELDITATLYCGVHADDGVNWAYPDCTPEFIGAMANAIFVGTYHKVRLRAPLQYDTKPDVIRKGHELGVDFSHTWSCYKGGERHCGVCPTCRSRKEAFDLNGFSDPTVYEEQPAVELEPF